MIQRHLTMSEPEGQCSDCSSYEELSSNSDSESEELSLSINKGNNELDFNNEKNRRKFSNTSRASYYRSWYLRRGSKSSTNSRNLSNEKKSTDSTDSLTSLVEVEKNWWYWMKFAVFISTPFIARQLGIFMGKRILVRLFRDTKI